MSDLPLPTVIHPCYAQVMSKTDKTKPSRVQIAEATAKYGEAHVNWHTDVTFSRTGPEAYWRRQYRKQMDRKRNTLAEGIEDWKDGSNV